MVRISTFLALAMLNATGFKTATANGRLELRSGPPPASADAAATGTLLALITIGGGTVTPGSNTAYDLNFDTATTTTISKAAAEAWSGVGIAAGQIGHYRYKGNAVDDDSADSSPTHTRIDGTVAVSGADLNMPQLTVAVGTPISISSFSFTLPLVRA